MLQNILEEKDNMENKIYIGWPAIEEFVDDLCYQIKTNHPEIKYVHGLKRGRINSCCFSFTYFKFKIYRYS